MSSLVVRKVTGRFQKNNIPFPLPPYHFLLYVSFIATSTVLSKKMDGIWNSYNLKSTGRIYTFGILKCSEKFKVLDLP